MLKRHLTLIFKVDNSLLPSCGARQVMHSQHNKPGEHATLANDVLTKTTSARRGFNESLPRMARHLRQEHREQAERRQEGAEVIDEGDRGAVSEFSEHGSAEPADAEGDAEEHA